MKALIGSFLVLCFVNWPASAHHHYDEGLGFLHNNSLCQNILSCPTRGKFIDTDGAAHVLSFHHLIWCICLTSLQVPLSAHPDELDGFRTPYPNLEGGRDVSLTITN